MVSIYDFDVTRRVTVAQTIVPLVADGAEAAISRAIIGGDIIHRYIYHLVVRGPEHRRAGCLASNDRGLIVSHRHLEATRDFVARHIFCRAAHCGHTLREGEARWRHTGNGDAGAIVAGRRRREGRHGGALTGIGILCDVSRTLACEFRQLGISYRDLERAHADVASEVWVGTGELSARIING